MSPVLLPLTIADKARDWLCPPDLDPIKDSQVKATQDPSTGDYTVHIDPHGALWNLPGTRARFFVGSEIIIAEIHVILSSKNTNIRRRFKRPLKPIWLRCELSRVHLDSDLLGWCAYVVNTLYNAPITFTVTPGRTVLFNFPVIIATQLKVLPRFLSIGTQLKVYQKTVSINNGPPVPHGEQLTKSFLCGDLEPDLPETL